MASDATARRYAHALFEIGVEHDKLEALYDQLDGVNSAFHSSKPFEHLLLHPGIEIEERRRAVRDLADSWGLDEMLVNFLYVLLDNERIRKIPGILETYQKLLDDREGNLRATITSAVELDGGEKRALKDVLSEKFGKDIILTTETNEDLIGGAVARVEGMVFDGSVRNELENLKENILEEV